MEKELIERNLLLSKISGRYDEKHDIVPDNLAEGFVQVEKLIKEQPVAFKVDEMLNYLADQKAHNESMTEAAPESVANTSMEEKEKVLSCYKIAIIGGHDNWTYKLKNKFKNWKFYRPEVTRTIDEKSLQTADYIYFFTDIMSHGSYCRYIKFVREYGLKFGYLHTINIESNINQIYEDIQNLEK